jgi:hypothetical protein
VANVIGTASVSITLTPSPRTASSQYHVGASNSLTLTPSTHGILWAAGNATAGVFIWPRASRAAWPTYRDPDNQKQTVTFEEAQKSREVSHTVDRKTYTRIFYIHGTYDTTKCMDIGPQPKASDDLIPTMVVTKREMEPFAWGGGYADMVKVTITYEEPLTVSDGGDSEATFTYDFTSEDVHVDVALSQTNYTPVGEEPAAGEDKLINFDGQQVEGMDIQAPVLEITEEHQFHDTNFTASVRRTLRDSVYTVNSRVFREFAIGEVLFIGASAQRRQHVWFVTFRFRVRRNVVKQSLDIVNEHGGTETVKYDKTGWQYLWVGVGKRPITTGGETKERITPVSVHVANVYQSIDFAVLGIGVLPLA